VVEDACVLFDGPAIVGIDRRSRGESVGRCAVITPAFLDPHCHIGMERMGDPLSESEVNERHDSILPLVDALDSVQMDDPAFQASVRCGVLYSRVLPGSMNVLGGRGAIIRNYAPDTRQALMARAGVKAAFGRNPLSCPDWKGTRPHTRMGAIALLRGRLAAVQAKRPKAGRKPAEMSAEEQVLASLLTRREVLIAHAHKADDVHAVLRLADDFHLHVQIQHSIAVRDGRLYAELKRRRIDVVYGPLDLFAAKPELRDLAPENVRLLIASGVGYGLMSDHPRSLQSNLLLQLRFFLHAGLSKQAAIEVLTRRNAELLGLHRQLGTLERGRWASFICWDGDPFDLASRPVAVFGEGRRLCVEGFSA
jgi:imidazolonepropionase-like amidohydrolase